MPLVLLLTLSLGTEAFAGRGLVHQPSALSNLLGHAPLLDLPDPLIDQIDLNPHEDANDLQSILPVGEPVLISPFYYRRPPQMLAQRFSAQHAVLQTAIPEPASMMLALLGLVAIAGCRCKPQ